MSVIRGRAPGYNSVFDTQTGFFARWGRTPDEDPRMCPVGPEILDIEISTVCHGIGRTMETRRPCSFCYKSNTGVGDNMSLATFSKLIGLLPKSVNQIAFGIGDIDGNPDLVEILRLCHSGYNIVPNLTTNGMGIDVKWADTLAFWCGAVAVSHYADDICFNAIKNLTDAGLKQVNIHKLLSKETYGSCFDLIDQVCEDPRLAKMKAIVFLLLKPKGDRNRFHSVDDMQDYLKLMNYARAKSVAIGMDSCSAPHALQTLPPECIPSIEPCESTLFSLYANTYGEFFPCSFTEGTPGWEHGILLSEIQDFSKDLWYHPRLAAWRAKLEGSSSGCDCEHTKHCRSCPIYDITICQPKGFLGLTQIVGTE